MNTNGSEFVLMHNGDEVIFSEEYGDLVNQTRKYVSAMKKQKLMETYEQCQFVPTRGKNKGHQCTKMCDPEKNGGYCSQHKPKSDSASDTDSTSETQDPKAPIPDPIKKVHLETKVQCFYMFKRGDMRGTQCSSMCMKDSGYCKKHTKKPKKSDAVVDDE